MFCGWTLKKGLFFWAPRYFALTRRGLLCWCARRRRRPARPRPPLTPARRVLRRYEGGEEALKLGGTLPLAAGRVIIKREKPASESDFSFVVKTPAATAKLDPGSKAAYDKWEEGLMMCISAASPLASR